MLVVSRDKLPLMDTNTRYVFIGIAGLFVMFIVGMWWVRMNPAPSNPAPATAATSTDATNSAQAATSSSSNVQMQPIAPKKTSPAPFALVQGETIASWDFLGSYKDGGQLEAHANAEIARAKSLLNSGEFTNYELYVSIANQYELLGNGTMEFTYLNYALGIDPLHTGLAWHNMGKLLERLGAYKSARIAYDRMFQAQPIRYYATVRLEFLKAHMPEDVDAIKKAEADVAASTE